MQYLKIYESFFDEQKNLNKEVTNLLKKNKELTNSFIEKMEDYLVELTDKYKIVTEAHFVDGMDLYNYTYVINFFIKDMLNSNLQSDFIQLKLFNDEYKNEYDLRYGLLFADKFTNDITNYYFLTDFNNLKRISNLNFPVNKWNLVITVRELKISN